MSRSGTMGYTSLEVLCLSNTYILVPAFLLPFLRPPGLSCLLHFPTCSSCITIFHCFFGTKRIVKFPSSGFASETSRDRWACFHAFSATANKPVVLPLQFSLSSTLRSHGGSHFASKLNQRPGHKGREDGHRGEATPCITRIEASADVADRDPSRMREIDQASPEIQGACTDPS